LRPITEATYGVMLYQEQLMQISKSIAGFSGAQADDLRKAIGKKKREQMAALKEVYFEGARASGTSESVINQLWAVNEAAADYSFNRSHAACYGLIGYRTAWLKANYPAEYMAALISSVMSTKDKVPFFVASCEDMGINVLPPDVNESAHDFTVHTGESGDRDTIRFGLDAVKNVGSAAVDKIVEARQADGPFTSVWDFCKRVDCQAVNRRAIEALIKCGALDSTGATRAGMYSVMEQAQAAGQKAQQDAQLGQGSIFDLGEPEPGAAAGEPDLPVPGLPDEREQVNAWEKETLGLFLSSHPLKEVRPALRQRVDCSIAELSDRKYDGQKVVVGGMITDSKRIRTRKGDNMMFATLDDLEGAVEMIVFAKGVEEYGAIIEGDGVLLVRGRVEHKDGGDIKLVPDDIKAYEPSPQELAKAAAMPEPELEVKRVTIEVAGHVPETFLDELKDLCRNNPGEHELELVVGRRRLRLGEGYRVSSSGGCLAELDQLTGASRRAA
ncbi:MAG TPA: OB-fold nucleic acid binding domain-containing protein, partial [Thermoleophilaceae bacterium]|nr:OB-fold nucleic acid binding domain-containing protein [Thermoleophilaceae bacterium]